MTASPTSLPIRRYAAFSLLLALGASCTDRNVPLEPTSTKPASGLLAAAQSPRVAGNFLVDLDHGQLFPENKQNEPAITRDPLTGILIAGANDEVAEPLCPGTTVPLASPCPFVLGVPISFFYRSTDKGQTWTGGPLPGFQAIGRTSGGDPSLDFGPRQCAGGSFSFACGSVSF